jgi:hypothetical protein
MELTIHVQKPRLVAEREERLAKEKAAGKKPKGPPAELPAPASSDNPPPSKRATDKEPGKDDAKKDDAKKDDEKKDADKKRGG